MEEIVNIRTANLVTILFKAMIVTLSPENIIRPVSSKSEEDNCSGDEKAESDIQHDTWIKSRNREASYLLRIISRLKN